MAEYYAVERTPEYLMHYGIRGMKWGVRKAIASGDSSKLSRQYIKASKKLAKLNERANIGKQQIAAKKYGKIAKISGAIGAAGVGASGVSKILQSRNGQNFEKTLAKIHNKTHGTNYASMDTTFNKTREFVINNKEANNAWQKYYDKNSKLHNAHILSGGIGAAGLAVSAVSGAKALAAKRRMTAAGHAAAVARRNEFQKEMNKAFAGTKYGNGKASIKKGTGSVVGVQVGKHFVGVSNKEITNGQRKRIKNYVKNSPRKVSLYRGK